MDRDFNDLLEGPDYFVTDPSNIGAKTKEAWRLAESAIGRLMIALARINGYLPPPEAQRQLSFAEQGIPERIPLSADEELRTSFDRTDYDRAIDGAILVHCRTRHNRSLNLR